MTIIDKKMSHAFVKFLKRDQAFKSALHKLFLVTRPPKSSLDIDMLFHLDNITKTLIVIIAANRTMSYHHPYGRFRRTTTRPPREEYSSYSSYSTEAAGSYLPNYSTASYSSPSYQYSHAYYALPRVRYYGYDETSGRFYEAPYPPDAPRRHYSDRRGEPSERRHQSYYRGQGRRYEHPEEEEAPTARSRRASHSNEKYRDHHEPSSKSHASESKKYKQKCDKPYSKKHASHSHEKDREHRPSSKSHGSHSQKKERMYYETPIIEEVSSEPEDSSEQPFSNRAAEREVCRAKISNMNNSKPKYASDPNLPFRIQQALTKGKIYEKFLGGTIHVVLLYEWCFDGRKVYIYPDAFEHGFEVIPVRRDKHGQFKPIEDQSNEWGIKTKYEPQYDIYLATILIVIPSVLTKVTRSQLKSAYRRFAIEGPVDKLKDFPEIPFKDDPVFKNYAIFFKFESGKEKPYLFDDYLLEDAVIRVEKADRGQ